jgi:hypothetical protein
MIDVPSFTNPKAKPVARLFPRMVREALINAARTERQHPPGESRARTQAVEAAINLARRECPGLFNNEKE